MLASNFYEYARSITDDLDKVVATGSALSL
jgi:hypothetical protein